MSRQIIFDLATEGIRKVAFLRPLAAFAYPRYEPGRTLMSSRSERCLAKAEECQQISDAADASGTKRLYGALASQWRQLAETDNEPLLETHAHFLQEIDKAEGAIRELAALKVVTPQEHRG
jgi:hypothetical protein